MKKIICTTEWTEGEDRQSPALKIEKMQKKSRRKRCECVVRKVLEAIVKYLFVSFLTRLIC